ncbi:MAG: M14 family zinc carboxypeptidase, partial [Patescibacteria group bacterium]|nr:M14 family zinc carboxypeptidase [Patescibacteria group bacterium]
DEDGPSDLNGDGWITAMRVEEPGGPYMEHPADARVMILADPKKGERGRWSLHVEGTDDDGDGQLNEDPIGGVAFDRNFTFNYPYFKPGAGPYQVSEPETKAVADFAFGRRNIALVLTFSAQDNLFHAPKSESSEKQGKIKTKLLEADAPYLERMAKHYRELHGGSGAPASPEGNGCATDWAYFHYGRWSLAARPWWIPAPDSGKADADKANEKTDETTGEDATADEDQPNPPPAKKPAENKASDDKASDDKASDDKRGQDDLHALAWFDRNGIDGFVPWQRIEHPDFPDRRVEVGGFKPYLRTNPPLAELEGLGAKHVDFLCRAAGMLPQLKIAEVKAESLGGGMWRVAATVVNQGELPTFPEMGEV